MASCSKSSVTRSRLLANNTASGSSTLPKPRRPSRR